jgi:hypothetical protein
MDFIFISEYSLDTIFSAILGISSIVLAIISLLVLNSSRKQNRVLMEMERLRNRPHMTFKVSEISMNYDLSAVFTNDGGEPGYIVEVAFFNKDKTSMMVERQIGIINPGATMIANLEKKKLPPTKTINVRIRYKNVRDMEIKMIEPFEEIIPIKLSRKFLKEDMWCD